MVTSKIISKAEGRVVRGERERWIDSETVRLVAQRGQVRIVTASRSDNNATIGAARDTYSL